MKKQKQDWGCLLCRGCFVAWRGKGLVFHESCPSGISGWTRHYCKFPKHFLSKKTILVHNCSNTLLWWNRRFNSKVNTCWLPLSWGKSFFYSALNCSLPLSSIGRWKAIFCRSHLPGLKADMPQINPYPIFLNIQPSNCRNQG